MPRPHRLHPRVRRRRLYYSIISPALLIVLLLALLVGILGSAILFGEHPKDSWKLVISIVIVFVVLTLLGVGLRFLLREGLFGALCREARERQGLVCPFDLQALVPLESSLVPHQFVRCTGCGRVGGEHNAKRIWKNGDSMVFSDAYSILFHPEYDESSLRDRDYHCPFDNTLLSPLGDGSELAVFGLCQTCECVFPFEGLMGQRIVDSLAPARVGLILWLTPKRVRRAWRRLRIEPPTSVS